MLHESSTHDSFIDMIDKLSVVTLSHEGEAILKSMADYIRAALEKGLLLEQIILKKRSKAAEEAVNHVKKSKKKDYKSPLCSNEIEAAQLSLQNTMLSEEVSPDRPLDRPDIFSRVIEKFVNETKPLNVRFKSPNNAPGKNKIKLVDQTSLLSPHLSKTFNVNKCNEFGVNTSDELMEEHVAQDSWVSSTNPQVNSQPLDSNIMLLNEQAASTESASQCFPFEMIVPKVEPDVSVSPIPELSAQVNSHVSDDCNIANQNCPMPINAPSNLDQPEMPFPIVIKSEGMPSNVSPQTGLTSPLNQSLSEEYKSKQNVNSMTENLDPELGKTGSIESVHLQEMRHHERDEEFKVFVETGKDATEEEVCALFKDLEIVSCRVINKPFYSYGFIGFSSEEHKNKALSISGEVYVRGKQVRVRPYYKERSKSKPRETLSQSPVPTKRASISPSQTSCKKQKFSDQSNNYQSHPTSGKWNQRNQFPGSYNYSDRSVEIETGSELDNSIHNDTFNNPNQPPYRTFYSDRPTRGGSIRGRGGHDRPTRGGRDRPMRGEPIRGGHITSCRGANVRGLKRGHKQKNEGKKKQPNKKKIKCNTKTNKAKSVKD